MNKQKKYNKIIDERYSLSEKQGAGFIKSEAWEYEGKVVRYNIVYINLAKYPYDNGRIIGYDNAHNLHHKHYLGDIYPVDDFVSYEELVERFKRDLKEFMK